VRHDDGDVFEFAHPGGTLDPLCTSNYVEDCLLGTLAHPWNTTNPHEHDTSTGKMYFAKLRTIIPQGVTAYRIRIYDETDANKELPAEWCKLIVDVDSTYGVNCNPKRGLLAAVVSEWKDGVTWRRGSSIVFKYAHPTFTTGKEQYLLDRIIEGADVDDQINQTRLVNFTMTQSTHDTTWRKILTKASSCLYRTEGSADTSWKSCKTDPTSELYRYTPAADPSFSSSFLVERVERPLTNAAGAHVLGPEETFLWVTPDSGLSFQVDAHESQGTVLSAPADPVAPNGMQTWALNGATKRVTMFRNRIVALERCNESGLDCDKRSARTLTPSLLNSHYILGDGSNQDVHAITTLRTFREDGLLDVEAVVVPLLGEVPTMDAFSPIAFTNVLRVRRLSKHYYTTQGTPREIAVATMSMTHQPDFDVDDLPIDYFFPDAPLNTWAYSGQASLRPLPENIDSAGGVEMYFDVTLTDADSDADGILNEVNDYAPVWSHHLLTGAGGAFIYSSTKLTRDAAGRVISQEEFRSPRESPVLSRSSLVTSSYFPVNSSTQARFRGRANGSFAYSSVKIRPRQVSEHFGKRAHLQVLQPPRKSWASLALLNAPRRFRVRRI